MAKVTNLFKKEKIVDEAIDRLEDRLFFVYIMCECIWLPIIGAASFMTGLSFTALTILGVLVITIMTSFLIQKYKKLFVPIKWIYLLFSLVKVPLLWYAVGGNTSSAGTLFILEIIFYSMVCKGKVYLLFIALSMLTSSSLSSLSGRFPERFGGYQMEPMQHVAMGSVMGATITIFITVLIVYQKKEYNREKKLAIEYDEQLKLSNKMQKNFLANMSHEIRSPLGIVLGFNDLIASTDDMDKINEYSSNIKDAGKTLQTVINDILDYSKIEAGKLDIIEADYSLHTLINELEKDIRLRCDEKGLEFIVERRGNIPNALYGDNIRIKQCIFNILTNAVKYTGTGTVTFTIECFGKDDNGYNQLAFTINDTGKGMSKELIPKLFTSFQRLNEGQNRGIEGTGLGLAITKSLLDQMNGTVEVTSEVNVGSTFIVKLGQLDGRDDRVDSVSDQEIDMSAIAGTKVLVVDDVDMNLVIIETILTSEGLNVTTVNSGQAALDICMDNSFDVILLDHMMPGMDGIETFGRLKKEGVNKNVPVIMLTANAMAGAKEEYYSYGINGYVTKPINQQLLNSEIVRVIKNN